MSTNEGWIKMSTRKPTKADRPFWTVYDNGQILVWNESDVMPTDDGWEATHWQPATLPEPPKKELTQRERDRIEAESSLFFPPYESYAQNIFLDAWHAALSYRDKQNAEDLEQVNVRYNAGEGERVPVPSERWNSLRRRCGLDQ